MKKYIVSLLFLTIHHHLCLATSQPPLYTLAHYQEAIASTIQKKYTLNLPQDAVVNIILQHTPDTGLYKYQTAKIYFPNIQQEEIPSDKHYVIQDKKRLPLIYDQAIQRYYFITKNPAPVIFYKANTYDAIEKAKIFLPFNAWYTKELQEKNKHNYTKKVTVYTSKLWIYDEDNQLSVDLQNDFERSFSKRQIYINAHCTEQEKKDNIVALLFAEKKLIYFTKVHDKIANKDEIPTYIALVESDVDRSSFRDSNHYPPIARPEDSKKATIIMNSQEASLYNAYRTQEKEQITKQLIIQEQETQKKKILACTMITVSACTALKIILTNIFRE